MPGPLDAVVKERVLERLAGERAWRRGVELHAHSHVEPHEFTADLAAAGVLDGAAHSVTLTSEAGELDPACPCPAAEGGLLCEHGVATALAWLEWRRSKKSKKTKPVRKKKLSVEESLALLPPERMVRMMLEVASAHPLAGAALQRLLALHSTQGLDVAALRKSIATQFAVRGASAVRRLPELVARADQVERDIRQVMAGGNAYAALDLCEAALIGIIKLACHMDRYWNDLVQIQLRFENLHAEAAGAARPAPGELAERIANLMLAASPAPLLVQVGQTHGAALGMDGLRALYALLPFHPMAINLNVSLAVGLGDARLLRRALDAHPSPEASHYVALGEIHAAQGDFAAAVEAAEHGLGKVRWDKEPLREAMLPWVAGLRGADAAVALAFAWFRQAPGIASYRQLRKIATQYDCWPEWEARLEEDMQSRPAGFREEAIWILHTLLLDDGNPVGALKLLRDHPDVAIERRLELAAVFDATKPRESVDLRLEYAELKVAEGRYPELIATLIEASRKSAENGASGYCAEQLGRFRARHVRKTSLQRLLGELFGAELGLPGAKLR